MAGYDNRDEVALFATMTIGELIASSDGLGRAVEAMHTLVNEPRCSPAVQGFMDEEIGRLNMIRSAAIAELERRPADGSSEDRERIGVLAAYELNDCGADVSATLLKLQRMSIDHAWAAAKMRTPCGHRFPPDKTAPKFLHKAL